MPIGIPLQVNGMPAQFDAFFEGDLVDLGWRERPAGRRTSLSMGERLNFMSAVRGKGLDSAPHSLPQAPASQKREPSSYSTGAPYRRGAFGLAPVDRERGRPIWARALCGPAGAGRRRRESGFRCLMSRDV